MAQLHNIGRDRFDTQKLMIFFNDVLTESLTRALSILVYFLNVGFESRSTFGSLSCGKWFLCCFV